MSYRKINHQKNTKFTNVKLYKQSFNNLKNKLSNLGFSFSESSSFSKEIDFKFIPETLKDKFPEYFSDPYSQQTYSFLFRCFKLDSKNSIMFIYYHDRVEVVLKENSVFHFTDLLDYSIFNSLFKSVAKEKMIDLPTVFSCFKTYFDFIFHSDLELIFIHQVSHKFESNIAKLNVIQDKFHVLDSEVKNFNKELDLFDKSLSEHQEIKMLQDKIQELTLSIRNKKSEFVEKHNIQEKRSELITQDAELRTNQQIVSRDISSFSYINNNFCFNENTLKRLVNEYFFNK